VDHRVVEGADEHGRIAAAGIVGGHPISCSTNRAGRFPTPTKENCRPCDVPGSSRTSSAAGTYTSPHFQENAAPPRQAGRSLRSRSGTARSRSRACSVPMRPGERPTRGSTPSSSPITVAGRWITFPQPLTSFPASPTPSGTASRCSSIPESGAGATLPPLSRSGARAVLVGRAHLYGLAAAGEAGVRHAIDILAEELRTSMALCGAATLADLDRDLIRVSGPPRAGLAGHAAKPVEQRAQL
jgi:FMN-dependent dehydrogenase